MVFQYMEIRYQQKLFRIVFTCINLQEFPLVEADPLFEDEGTARLGFVQLNSGSSNFNTTLNLTGPILLGMGIAAATLFYAYFNAFQG